MTMGSDLDRSRDSYVKALRRPNPWPQTNSKIRVPFRVLSISVESAVGGRHVEHSDLTCLFGRNAISQEKGYGISSLGSAVFRA